MRKKSASAIALALCAAMAVPTMAAVKFADENDVPWETAKVYISQAAEMGLMVGQQNNDGTSLFRAKDKVTYFETIQLSYNMLREASKAVPSDNVTDKWKTVMAGYKVPAWAYEATAYCLENKIVLVNELQGFVGADGKRGNATREDVAVIFGRTLSAVYDTDSNAKLEFNDKDKISKDAAEFVALLYNKGILLGDNNSNFNPANYINRAEMAVIVTKTYNVLNGKSADDGIETFAGTVSSVSDGNKNFSINVSDGKSSKEFSGDRDTPASMDSESYSFLDIEKGDKVTVVYKDKEVLLAVVEKAKPEKAAAGDVSGMINNILSDRVVLEGSSGGTDVYNFASPVLLTLNGKPSTYKEIFKAVENGAEIKAVVTINSAGLAEEVAAKGNADEVNGTVSDMDKNAFVIKRNGGDEEYYYCAGSCYISFEGEKINIADAEDLIDEYKTLSVKAKINEDDELLEVNLSVLAEGGNIAGSIKNVTSEKATFFQPDGSKKSYKFADGVYVTVDGEESSVSRLARLADDDKVGLSGKASLNKQKAITKIEVEISDNLAGVINELDDYHITVLTDAGITKRYALDEDVEVKFGSGDKESMEDLKKIFQKGSTKVKLVLNRNDEVKKITVYVDFDDYDVLSGTLNSVETGSFRIRRETVKYSNSTEITINGESAAAYDLYKRCANGETMEADVVVVDGEAKIISAAVTEAEGQIVKIESQKITIKGKNSTAEYNVLSDDDDELVVRIDGFDKKYTYQDLNGRVTLNKDNYNATLIFNDDYEVKRIYAESID